MKKQIVIIGIVTLLVIVGLSGCNKKQEQKPVVYSPSFGFLDTIIQDTCESTYPGNGTVWVNISVHNYGFGGTKNVYCRVYQGIENFQLCGNGHIYNQTIKKEVYLKGDETKRVSFVFTDINCENGTGCYGHDNWIEQ